MTTDGQKKEEFVYSQWMKLLMLNISENDVLNDNHGPSEITMEQMRAGFGLGFRFALDRTSEFIEKYCDLPAEEKKKLLGFMAEQYEISYLHNSKDKLSELSHRLRKKDGWGFNKESYLHW